MALAERGDRVLLVVVSREHDDAGLGMPLADRVRAVDPSSWNDGGILMSVTTTSGACSAAVASKDGASSATPTTSMSS